MKMNELEQNKVYVMTMQRAYIIAEKGLDQCGVPKAQANLDYWARTIYPLIARPAVYLSKEMPTDCQK